MRTVMLVIVYALVAPLCANALTVGSNTFKQGARLPMRAVYNEGGCTGQNRSPELHWSAVPARTKSFVVIVHDPDAPVPGGFDHWFAYNIPASRHELSEAEALGPDQQGTNGFDKREYDGPCPPPGKPHRYVFTLYALDVPRVGDGGLSGRDLEHAMRGHILASAHISGTYGR